MAVTELPGAESLLGEEAAKSIFLSPNATPGICMPRECCSTSKQEPSTGLDRGVPAGLDPYLENLKLPREGAAAGGT